MILYDSTRVLMAFLFTVSQVFGKPLITQPVIQAKLSEMAAQVDLPGLWCVCVSVATASLHVRDSHVDFLRTQVEAMNAWLDSVTHQMQTMEYSEQALKLAGPIALLK